MLKQYILALCLPFSLFSQDNFELLDKSGMTTSILYDRAFNVANLTDNDQKVNATYFNQAYSELSQSDYQERFEKRALYDKIKEEAFREKFIPIGIIHTEFNTIKNSAFEDGYIALDASHNVISTGIETNFYDTHQKTIAASLLPKYRGLQSKFKILSDLITNTTASNITAIKIDFDDGLGLRSCALDTEIVSVYTTAGEKQLKFEIGLENGQVVTASSYIKIELSNSDLNTRAPGDESPITAINSVLTYQGFGEAQAHLGTGEYKIYYDNVDGILDKPIFFVDGFDPGDGRTIPLMYNLLDFGNPVQNLAELARDQGFDLVVLNFPTYVSASDNTTIIDGGADFIQRNAFIFIELLNTINAMKEGTNKNVVIGPSMGGLISRYALRYMEQNAMNHDTRLYMSFDSPHRGANVPIGIQYLFNYMLNGDPAVVALEPLVNGLLGSAAAKQMLIDHYSSHLSVGSMFLQDPGLTLPEGAANFRTEFQTELDGMGFPQTTRNVSMINGSGIGAGTGTPGMSLINHTFDTGVVVFPTQAIISSNFTPASSSTITVTDFVGQIDFTGGFGVWTTVYSFQATAQSPSFTDGPDSAPGGLFDLGGFDDGTDPLITEFVNNLNINYFDFIPSVSALALDVTGNGEINWYHNIDLGDGDPPSEAPNSDPYDVINTTPFVNWFMPDTNEVHVTLTETNVNFALMEIFSETLSTSEYELTGIKLEKNPVEDQLNLLLHEPLINVKLSMYDMFGRQVSMDSLGEVSTRISLPIQLNSGIYILKLASDSGSFTTKFIVK
ncbi:MAG: T9SS type A sorting domain-containing protein [Flavobacteriaceae bacterium]|nr:T9SS type A sorting domain-containing protein [Flavobacteriaceae bacterium]